MVRILLLNMMETYNGMEQQKLRSMCVYFQQPSHVWDPMDCSHQAPLSMEFFRQGNRSELPFPSPGDLPDPGTEPRSLVSPALAGGFFTTVPPGKPLYSMGCNVTFMLTMREIRQRKVR